MIKVSTKHTVANVTKIWQQCFCKSYKQVIECPYCIAPTTKHADC